jgi:hypothetical protein
MGLRPLANQMSRIEPENARSFTHTIALISRAMEIVRNNAKTNENLRPRPRRENQRSQFLVGPTPFAGHDPPP